MVPMISYSNAAPTTPVCARGLEITGIAGLLMVSVSVFVPVPAALMALSVMDKTPFACGVPEITPVISFKVRVAGSGAPPTRVARKDKGLLLAVIVYENKLFTVAVATSELLITEIKSGIIERVKLEVPDPPAFEAVMTTLKLPSTVGVPDITPVAIFKLNPAGSPVTLKFEGLLVAVTV